MLQSSYPTANVDVPLEDVEQPTPLPVPTTQPPATASLQDHLFHSFKDIFISPLHYTQYTQPKATQTQDNDVPGLVFSTYEDAYAFGKHMAQLFGFHIRIKTTGYNLKEGIIYKYVCCKRQGKPEHSAKEKQKRQFLTGTLQKETTSVRCGCKWNCRLIGAKVSMGLDGARPNSLHEEDSDLIWYWCASEVEHDHNHALDVVPDPMYAGATARHSTGRRRSSSCAFRQHHSAVVEDGSSSTPLYEALLAFDVSSSYSQQHRTVQPTASLGPCFEVPGEAMLSWPPDLGVLPKPVEPHIECHVCDVSVDMKVQWVWRLHGRR